MPEKKILIVDYDAKSLDYLARLFGSYDFEVIRAADGLAAYDSFKKERPDLIILEAMLPKLHGFDLTKKISQETDGRTPIIIVTGLYRGPQYRNEALNFLGASDYFEKPVDESRLMESVLNHLKVEPKIEEDLPNSDAVLSGLSKRLRKQPQKAAEGKITRSEKGTKPENVADDFESFLEDEFSDLEVDVDGALSSLLKEKQKGGKKKP